MGGLSCLPCSWDEAVGCQATKILHSNFKKVLNIVEIQLAEVCK